MHFPLDSDILHNDKHLLHLQNELDKNLKVLWHKIRIQFEAIREHVEIEVLLMLKTKLRLLMCLITWSFDHRSSLDKRWFSNDYILDSSSFSIDTLIFWPPPKILNTNFPFSSLRVQNFAGGKIPINLRANFPKHIQDSTVGINKNLNKF